ncbi:hypothetical protein ACVWXO_000886 [Bradyrhizobium sp. LM2.7]
MSRPFAPLACWWAPDDCGVNDQVLKVTILCERLEHAQPDPLGASSAEATENALPFAKHSGQITPGRAGPNNPQDAIDKHAVVSPRRTPLVRPTDNQAGHTVPLNVAKNIPIHDTQGFLLKGSLESRSI